MKNKIFILAISFLTNSIFSERIFSEKPDYVDYKLPDISLDVSMPRQRMIRFPKAGIIISNYCVYKKNKDYTSRNCKAWSVYDYIDSGKLVPLIREKGFFAETDPTSRVANLICKESKGTIETEVDEFNPNGRKTDLEDFCEFKDGSKATFSGILLYIYRNAPTIKKEIESARKSRNEKKLLVDPKP